MPAPVLNAAARLICPHGGQVLLAPKQEKLLVGGMPALAEGDLIGAVIVKCEVKATALTSPCTAIISEIPAPGVGQSLKLKCQGRPVLIQGVQTITNSRPPGTTEVVFPGQTVMIA